MAEAKAHPVLCGNTLDKKGRPVTCDHWLGESPEPLVYVDSVAKGADVRIPPPRDVRICKGCGGVAVFVPRRALDRIL